MPPFFHVFVTLLFFELVYYIFSVKLLNLINNEILKGLQGFGTYSLYSIDPRSKYFDPTKVCSEVVPSSSVIREDSSNTN
jgi:hypothetical protein